MEDEAIKEEKAALRPKMKTLLAEHREEAPISLNKSPLADIILSCKTVFAFASMPGEPDTQPICELALKEGKTLLLPRVNSKSLDFAVFEGAQDELRPNRFGTLEPADSRVLFSSTAGEEDVAFSFPALIIVPGLAFDRRGSRLGRGAGFYDRFLSEFAQRYPRPRYSYLVAGLCFDHQIVDAVPVEKGDFAMDCLSTPDGSIIEAKKI